MPKVFGYSRSNRGMDGINFQNQQLINYARHNNLKIEKTYYDIGSGTHVGSYLQKLIHEIPNNSILIVTERSRISRLSIDYELIMNELSSKNVRVVFTNSK